MGLPLSGVIGKARIMDAPPDSAIGGTYVGNPVAQAAALAVLDVIGEEDLCARASVIGDELRERMTAWQHRFPQIGDVRGLGAMLAIELVEDPGDQGAGADLASAVAEEAAPNGLLLLKSGIYSNCIRVLTPLTLSDAELDEALRVWEDALEAVLGLTHRSSLCPHVCGGRDRGSLRAARADRPWRHVERLAAHDRLLDRTVAIKVLHEQFTARTRSTSSASGARRARSRSSAIRTSSRSSTAARRAAASTSSSSASRART